MKIQFKIITLALLLLLVSCSVEPEQIDFGHDECELCKMTISEQKYGAEIVNKNGKSYKFDALECMVKYINDKLIESEKIHSVWTIDYSNPKTLIDAEKAFYLRSKSLPSPMAMFFTSFSNKSDLEKTKKEHLGDVLNWDDIQTIVKEEWD